MTISLATVADICSVLSFLLLGAHVVSFQLKINNNIKIKGKSNKAKINNH